jgi:hypothetical protein
LHKKEKELKKKMAIYQKQMVKIPTVMTSDSHDPVTSSLYHGDRHCLEFALHDGYHVQVTSLRGKLKVKSETR